MAAPVVLSTSKVNPLSTVSAMRRASGQSEAHAKRTQFESQLLQVRKVGKETVIAQQATQSPLKSMSVFPYLSTLAMMQSVPQRPLTPARLHEYETMAASNEQDVEIGLGKTLDMHA